MGSVPGDSDFQSDWSDQPKPSRGLTRPDLGSMPMTKPQFGGSLSALGSGPLGSEPGFAPPGGPGGPLGIINYRFLTTETNLKVFFLFYNLISKAIFSNCTDFYLQIFVYNCVFRKK